MAKKRIIRGKLLLLPILYPPRLAMRKTAHRIFHIALTRAKPDFAYDDICEDYNIIALDAKITPFRFGFEGLKIDSPLAVLAGFGRYGLPGEFNGDLLAALRFSPYGNALRTLKNHIIAEYPGQFDTV